MLRRTFAAALPLALFAPPTRAQAPKKLVVYTSNDSTLNDLVFGAFRAETGIEVEPVAAGSGVVMRRLQAEKARPLGDIIWGVSRSLLQTNKALFEPYVSKNRDATPAEYRDPDNLWIGNNLHLLVILQNTKIVPEAEGPKSWADLWGGGEAGWKKVAQLFKNMKVLNRSSLVFQGVGNGEYPLGISLEYAGPMWAQGGAPVKVIYPSDGTFAAMEGVAVIKGGPNIENAKVFVDPARRHAAALPGQTHQLRRGGLDREAHQDPGADQGRAAGFALSGRHLHFRRQPDVRHGTRRRQRQSGGG